jgi:hypothetical protein
MVQDSRRKGNLSLLQFCVRTDLTDFFIQKRPRNDTLIAGSSPLFSPGGGIATISIQDSRPAIVRAHTLPFRLPSEPSSAGSMYTPPSTAPLTEDSSTSASPASIASLPLFPDSADVEMHDDDISIVGSQSPPSPYITWKRPAKLDPQSLQLHSPRHHVGNGRVPTPRFPTFSSHLISPPASGFLEGAHLTPSAGMPLPSPIKEEEMDAEVAGTQLSRLSMGGDEGMDLDEFESSAVQLPGSLLPRRTRQRSGAITATTPARRLVNGYLDTCEKCRNKVPGHLMHFLPA